MFSEILEEIAAEVRPHFGKGKVASYIPALGEVDPRSFGMAIATADGELYRTGDADRPFSIQSISKLFSLWLAMRLHGDEIWRRVGKEPSGTRFNSLVLLESEGGFPRNPFINAGALVILDSLFTRQQPAPSLLVQDYVQVLSQDFGIERDRSMWQSELRAAHQNAAIAHMLKAHGMIANDPYQVVKEYCGACSIAMTCEALAKACLPLAAEGVSPLMGEQVLTERQVRRINALMMTSGMYDSVGSFAYRVGLPAKSGVGGGIVAIVPRTCSIAVWAPELDNCGNSLVGTLALEALVRHAKLSVL